MKYLLTLTLAIMSASPLSAALNVINQASSQVSGRYLVVLNATTPAQTAAPALVQQVGGTLAHTFKRTINGFSFFGTEAQALAMTGKSGVYEVWEVGRSRAAAIQTAPPQGLDRIDQRELPLDGEYTYTMPTTRTVNIYVVDSGLDPTFDLEGRVIGNINF
ncbi:MAG TPA: hypothetical protein VF787_05155 [Thermoanaerobaculia bacterium]